LRHVGLRHDSDASVPLGYVYTNPPHWGGLTAFGADVIKECNRLGILVDLTHCNNETIGAALKIASKPILISHTGLNSQLGQNPNMAKMMMPRLISKKQAKIVADAGGVIGVWTHLSKPPLEYAQNIKAIVDIIGIDHVCFGTDTKMTPAYRPPGGSGPQPQPVGGNSGNRQDGLPQGKNGPAGGTNRGRIGEGTNEACRMKRLVSIMLSLMPC
jgi:membrane dipeptidase